MTDGGDLSVRPSAALIGVNGLEVVIDGNEALFVEDNTPTSEPRYRARFYFDPNSIVMGRNDTHSILVGQSGQKFGRKNWRTSV